MTDVIRCRSDGALKEMKEKKIELKKKKKKKEKKGEKVFGGFLKESSASGRKMKKLNASRKNRTREIF